jgi:hypothetical protein
MDVAEAAEPIVAAVAAHGDGMILQIIIWVAALLVQTIFLSVVGTWWVRNLVDSIRSDIRAERKEVDLSIATLENQVRDRIDAIARDLNQKIESAYNIFEREIGKLRDRLHDHELHVRDTYARRESFYTVTGELKTAINEAVTRLEARIDALAQSRTG